MTLDLVNEPARLEKPMDHVAHWTVDLFVAEHEDSVTVRAELTTPGGPIRERGEARLTTGPLRQPESPTPWPRRMPCPTWRGS